MALTQASLRADEPSPEVAIRSLLLGDRVDLVQLRQLARRPGGFQSHALRKLVWPKLLGVNRFATVNYRSFLTKHRDEYQVWCDVTRLWGDLQPMAICSQHYQNRRRKHVGDIIQAILCHNPRLFYYQGYHDIASTFLLILEDNHLTFAALETVTRAFLADFMAESFEPFARSLNLIMQVVQAHDPQLFSHLQAIPNFQPFFATSWILSWFAHDLSRQNSLEGESEVQQLEGIARIFDLLLASPPVHIYYLSAAIVLLSRDALLASPAELAAVHVILREAPTALLAGGRCQEVVDLAEHIARSQSLSSLLLLLPAPAPLLQRKVGRGDCFLQREHSLALHIARVQLVSSFAVKPTPARPPGEKEVYTPTLPPPPPPSRSLSYPNANDLLSPPSPWPRDELGMVDSILLTATAIGGLWLLFSFFS